MCWVDAALEIITLKEKLLTSESRLTSMAESSLMNADTNRAMQRGQLEKHISGDCDMTDVEERLGQQLEHERFVGAGAV